jgi:hypothetical protein
VLAHELPALNSIHVIKVDVGLIHIDMGPMSRPDALIEAGTAGVVGLR